MHGSEPGYLLQEPAHPYTIRVTAVCSGCLRTAQPSPQAPMSLAVVLFWEFQAGLTWLRVWMSSPEGQGSERVVRENQWMGGASTGRWGPGVWAWEEGRACHL